MRIHWRTDNDLWHEVYVLLHGDPDAYGAKWFCAFSRKRTA